MSLEQTNHGTHPWVNYDHIIVFDAVCTFCIGTVEFVQARDPQEKFKFGTLQSDAGRAILIEHNLNPYDFETFLYIENGEVFTRSTAALKVVKSLTGLWPLLYGLIVVPQAIRDSVYQFVARRRYRLMGKQEVCRVPSGSNPNRFI